MIPDMIHTPYIAPRISVMAPPRQLLNGSLMSF